MKTRIMKLALLSTILLGCFSLGLQASQMSSYQLALDSADTCDAIVAPTGLGATVTSAGVTFFWDFIPNAIACQVRVKRIGEPGNLTLPLVLGPPPPTSLFWDADSIPIDSGKIGFAVRCWCDSNTVSNWSMIDTVCLDSLFLRVDPGSIGIAVYPNPVANNLQLTWRSVEEGLMTTRVYDVQGRLAAEQVALSSQGQMRFDTSSWASGMYVIEYTVGGATNRIRVLKH